MAQPGASTTAPRQQEVPPASAGAAIERVLALALAASWHVTRVADFQPDR